jgi:hypothetical protein
MVIVMKERYIQKENYGCSTLTIRAYDQLHLMPVLFSWDLSKALIEKSVRVRDFIP